MSPGARVPTSGRLSPLPFSVAVVAVYLVSFGSQVLLAPPVTSRLSVVPFVLVQAALIGLWIVLHARRLRDAGRSIGIAVGVALVYVLEIVLVTILVWLILASSTGGDAAGGGAPILQLFIILYLLSSLAGDPHFGAVQFWILAFVALMMLPVAIALGFSLWTAMRPSAPAAAPAAPAPSAVP